MFPLTVCVLLIHLEQRMTIGASLNTYISKGSHHEVLIRQGPLTAIGRREDAPAVSFAQAKNPDKRADVTHFATLDKTMNIGVAKSLSNGRDVSVLKADSTHFPINQQEGCSEGIFLLVVVCSAVGNFEQRRAIRDSWGKQITNYSDRKLLFLVGKTEDTIVQSAVIEEDQESNDLIQADFIDSYRNLTIKSIAMLRWIQEYCRQPPTYILKSDDDMFINIPLLLEDLHNTVHKRFIMGQMIAGAQPTRDRQSKWYTSEDLYSDSFYPEYISGCAYVISGDLLEDLYKSTFEIKPFWIEDVYITGMCAKFLGSTHLFNGKFGYRSRTRDACVFRNVITAHRMGSLDLRQMWKMTFDEELKC